MDKFEDNVTPMQLTEEYREVVNIIPSLHKYKANHNTTNLQKLCVEVAEFCRNIFSSTRNEEERNIYYAMLDKLNKR